MLVCFFFFFLFVFVFFFVIFIFFFQAEDGIRDRDVTGVQTCALPTPTVSSLLTPFSKFFSPFLRSTCSLSVFRRYLVLEEVYLPIRPEIPS